MTNSISDDAIDLFDLNYRFAIQRVDPGIGEIVAWQVYRENDDYQPIELVNCKSLEEEEKWEVFLSDRVT